MALTNMHSDLRFNPSSGLAFFFSCTCMAVKFFPIPTIYFASWGVINIYITRSASWGVMTIMVDLELQWQI